MIRIAVVGDIGSGKSHIAKLFGYPVFNADAEVAYLYKKSRKCYNKLKKALPNYVTSFPIKKNVLAKAILENKKNLRKITKIVHPEVRIKMNSFVKKYKKKRFIVLDIPLLLENKLNKKNDIIIFVDARKKDINKMLKKKGKINTIFLKKFQLPLEKKRNKANFIIKNNFNNNLVKKSVKRVKEKILLNEIRIGKFVFYD